MKESIKEMLDSLETARIHSGAEFERLCNMKEYEKALFFQNIRDTLQAQIGSIKSYQHLNRQ